MGDSVSVADQLTWGVTIPQSSEDRAPGNIRSPRGFFLAHLPQRKSRRHLPGCAACCRSRPSGSAWRRGFQGPLEKNAPPVGRNKRGKVGVHGHIVSQPRRNARVVCSPASKDPRVASVPHQGTVGDARSTACRRFSRTKLGRFSGNPVLSDLPHIRGAVPGLGCTRTLPIGGGHAKHQRSGSCHRIGGC